LDSSPERLKAAKVKQSFCVSRPLLLLLLPLLLREKIRK
jgi:hypothetical protein